MKTYVYFLLYILICSINGEAGKPIQIEFPRHVAEDFPRKNDNCWSIYDIRQKACDEAALARMLGHLRKQEFSQPMAKRNRSRFCFSSTTGSERLTYSEPKSQYTYRNRHVRELSEYDRADTAGLRMKAREHVAALLGQRSEDYVLRNREIETMAVRGGDEVISRIGYRFVRVIECRMILGNASHIRLFLGRNGNICHFLMNDPELVKIGTIHRKITVRAARKAALQIVNDRSYVKSILTGYGEPYKVSFLRADPSYFRLRDESGSLLIPHFSFVTRNELEDGRSVTAFINLPADNPGMNGIIASEFIQNGDSSDVNENRD